MSAALVVVLTFMSVTLGVTAVYSIVWGLLYYDASLVRQRVDEEFGKPQGQAPRSPLFKNLDELNPNAAPPDFESEEAPAPAAGEGGLEARVRALIEQANLGVTPRQLLLLSAGLGLALGLACTLFRGPLLGTLGAAVGASAPLAYVRARRAARRERFLKQLPGAFDLMARVIRTGQSVPQALQAVAEASEEPVAGAFSECEKRQNLGLSPEAAFRELARTTGVLEVRIFVMALIIQRQTGGKLSDVLERLAGLIRDRLRLRKQVRTLTAEGRLQGLTLLVLPFLMFAAMMVLNRAYAESLLEHVPLLVATGVSMGVGFLWIRRIVNFEV